MATSEALVLLALLARLKDQRFGRVAVTVSDGRMVSVEVLEKIDRAVLRALSE